MLYNPPINGDTGNANRPYIDANPSMGIEGSIPPAAAIEYPQREILAVITGAGLTPSNAALDQLKTAIQNMIAASNSPAITGISNLAISTTGTSAIISITADEILLKNNTPTFVRRSAFSASINCAATGKNGLSTGTLAASTGYYIYAGWDGTANCAWIDPSPSAPTVPATVTHWKRIGWISTDSSGNKYPLRFQQKNDEAQFITAAAGNVTALPVIASGVQGDVTTPTYVAVSLVNKVPATARKVNLQVYESSTSVIVSPNNVYGGIGSLTNPPFFNYNINNNQAAVHSMMLESMNIYYACNGASGGVRLAGWIDTL